MEPQATWVATGVALIGIGMAALGPPPWVSWAAITLGVFVAAVATLSRWFAIVRRRDNDRPG